ncbi:uncharacterized protein LOC112529026 [Cynara cardunculus var. scolymus]|uniref:uncharacterized protein LOC112529026 n=1 Tax=Cynara cardunculus var. scolymus TaxID=59895 RepID=UPI000D62D832|nr:uncharacterized protein LOC112529026 [Cynara cardunculus var. scolymus]
MKELLSMMQVNVRTNIDAIVSLNSKVDELQVQLARHGSVQPRGDSDDLVKRLDDLTSSLPDDNEGEKYLPPTDVTEPEAEVKKSEAEERSKVEEAEGYLPQALILQSEAKAEELHILIPHSKDAIISHEAEAKSEDDDDVVIALAEDEDLPTTSTSNVGDKDEDDDDDEDDSLSLPDVGQDLGGDGDDDDDDDDDNDNFTIQYHTRPAPAQKGVSLLESSSQREKSQGDQHTTSKN